MNTPSILPIQKLTDSKKYAKDSTYFEDTANFYIEDCRTLDNEKIRMANLYNLLGTSINPSDYSHLINPFNIAEDKYKRVPAKLRNYNIILPILNLFLGEKEERIEQYQVVTTPNEENDYQAGWTKQLIAHLAQDVVNKLIQAGVPIDAEQKELPEIEELKKKYDDSYGDIQSVFGQEALDYIIYDQDLKDKEKQLVTDYFITGSMYTMKDILDNDVDYRVLSPLFSYHQTPQPYQPIEDLPYFIYRDTVSPNQVLDDHRHELSDEDITALDEASNNSSFLSSMVPVWLNTENMDNTTNSSFYYSVGKLNKWLVFFKGMKPIQILTYVDMTTGTLKDMEVTSDYEAIPELGDINLKTEWISCNYMTIRVDLPNDKKIFLRKQEIPVDRSALNNSSKSPLPVNGRVNITRTGEILSIAAIGAIYQISTNIIMFQAEKVTNKLRAALTTIPISLFPNNHVDWGQDKFMWASAALDLLILDDSNPRSAQTALNAVKSIDTRNQALLGELYDVAARLKGEFWEAIGMNRQRYGDIKASAGKATTEQAQYRSAIISEEFFRVVNHLIVQDLEGLVDYSKLAWIEGKKGMYLNSTGRKKWLELNPDNAIQHANRDYRLFVSNSKEERDKLTFMKDKMLFSAAQNGLPNSVQFAMLNANNTAVAERRVKEAEDIINRMQANMAEQEAKAAEAQLAIQQEKNQIAKYGHDMSYKETIDSLMLKIQAEQPERYSAVKKDFEELRLKWGQLDVAKEANKIKREEIDAKKYIAKLPKQSTSTNNK